LKKGLLAMQASRLLKISARPLPGALFALFIFLLVSLVTITPALAQTPPETAPPPPQEDDGGQQEAKAEPTPNVPAKSIVRGRVIYEDTNRPVRRARILLLKSDGGGGMEKSGVTDERGEFIVKEVAAGSYFVMVDAPGVISPISSLEFDDSMNERAAIIALRKEFEEFSVNGTNSISVQIRARRGGVITGRITYPDGDPATNAQIVILRKKDNRLIRFITGFTPSSLLSLKTDDRGIYRIAGLPPGEYVLGASEANARGDVREDFMGALGGSSFSVSYYQNETSVRRAATVKVEAGQEAGEINITLLDRPFYTISGTVVARQGRAPVRAHLILQVKSEGSGPPFLDTGATSMTDEQGRWTFADIPDGSYVIKVDPAMDTSAEEGQETLTTTDERDSRRVSNTAPRRPSLVPRQQELTVSGADLSGITIELSEGGRLQGTVIMEGNDKQLLPGFNASLTPRDGSAVIDRYGTIQPGGSFLIDNIPPGEFYLSVQQLGDRFYVKSIAAGGTDLMREPFRIGSGTSVDNVRITISSDIATLQGRVVSPTDGKGVRGMVVLLFPSDPARWRFSSSFVPGVTDTGGDFKITAPPGHYLLITLGAGENLRSVNEAFLRTRAAGAKAVTLQPNGRETIELAAPSATP
jgi:hypothetical protein